MVMIASGFFTSCATPAARRPMLFIFSASISCSWIDRSSSLACFKIRQRQGEFRVRRLQLLLRLLGLGDVPADAHEPLHLLRFPG